jgi:integrase
MPKLKECQIPSYRLHMQSGQAIVTLNARDHLLGKHGSAASIAEYRRLTAEWLANAGLPVNARNDLTVSELVLAFWKHAQAYYRRADGSQTKEVGLYRVCAEAAAPPTLRLDPRCRLCPRCLKVIIQHMIELRWCRTSINKHSARIKHLFRWAVQNELVPPHVHYRLVAASGLRKGRSDAVESDPVRPVAQADVDAVLPHASDQVAAMIKLQMLTAMRPGETRDMRGCDIDVTGRLWLYKPASHKNEHRGHERTIYLGPQAQAVVAPFLKPNLHEYMFAPRDADVARRAKLQPAPPDPTEVRKPPRHEPQALSGCLARREIQRYQLSTRDLAWLRGGIRDAEGTTGAAVEEGEDG